MEKVPLMKWVMTAFPYFIDVDASVRQARSMMLKHNIRHLPAKDRGSLVGVLTDRDLKRALDTELGLASKDELVVRDILLRDAYVVDLEERLDKVLLELARQHIDCVLVTKEGRLAGIFTATDACRVFGEYLRSHFGLDRDPDVA